jgi:type I restriction enzyme R subunit
MSIKPIEKDLEDTIEQFLTECPIEEIPTEVSAGNADVHEPLAQFIPKRKEYRKLTNAGYDRRLALVPDELAEFVRNTQFRQWEKLVKGCDGNEDAARKRLAERISSEIDMHGTIAVLRMKQIDVSQGAYIQLMYTPPTCLKTQEHAKLYSLNRLGIMRQVHYSEKDRDKSIDIVLFLNGLPIITLELKNELTGQSHLDAIKQYMCTRQVKGEKLLEFKRCLVHFAVGTEQVFMTTKLDGPNTYFMPYNKTYANIGLQSKGYRTDYLWRDVLRRDSVMNLLTYYINVHTEVHRVYNPQTHQLEETTSTKLIFPRWHQRRVVKRLVEDAKNRGAGHRYLIQHSAGSGKSHTITWLAFRLSSLYQHSTDEKKLFDSVIVVNDRVALDLQMQRNFKQFEQTEGEVVYIDEKCTSQDLKDAIEHRKLIVVTTLQKFPVIADNITKYPDRKFAVLIDEAHSSQTGSAARQMRKALSLEEAEEADREANKEESDDYDSIAACIQEHIDRTGPQKNVSFYAFTATPKKATLKVFCEKSGSLAPFDVYSMEDAIHEGFILNPIENYMSYKRYYTLMRNQEIPDKEHDKRRTIQLLSSMVDIHPTAIEKKSRLMIEHFAKQTVHEINGEARAMLVTSSRLHAVRYKLQFDKIMQEMRLGYKALVAFSGSVKDPDSGMEYTEQSMNGLQGRCSIPDALKIPQYRILIVANKYQTGFDEPRLHTMFVDKKLNGANAVQTLSRLNRKMSGKTSTLVLDFVNNPDDIKADFERFYGRVYIPEENIKDSDSIYQLKSTILNSESYQGVLTRKDLDDFAEIFWAADYDVRKQEVYPVLDRVMDRAKKLPRAPKDLYVEFRGYCKSYVSLFDILSQIERFNDPELLKLYEFVSMLVMKLNLENTTMSAAEKKEICDGATLDSYKLKFESLRKISLKSNDFQEHDIPTHPIVPPPPGDHEFLSIIIKALNDTFGVELNEEDKLDLERLHHKVTSNVELLEFFTPANSRDNIRMRFDEEVDNELLEFTSDNLDFYNKMSENRVNAMFKQMWFNELYDARVRGIPTPQ